MQSIIAKVSLCIFGVAMIVGSWFMYQSTNSFVKSAEKATGTVVRVVQETGNHGATYSPVISYVTKEGQTEEFQQASSDNITHYSIGQQLGVLYDPTTPNYARTDSFSELWLFPSVLLGFGLLMVVLSFIGRN